MALTDYKITDGDISTHGVVSAPDKLAGTAAENKAVFDALIRDAVKAKFNDLIDELVTDLAGKMVSPGSYGSAGQYLQTNGDGTVTWNSPSGSGDMQRSVYDTDEDGTVNSADYATAAGTATEAGSAGSCTGNAATASKLSNARNLYISDSDGTHTGAAVAFDGSANKTLKLPAIISAALTGNAATATKLAAARTIGLTDADGTNTGTAVTFDGSANKTLKLPATIKANITGNASGSSGSCTGNSATATKLATARTISLTDADGTNTGSGVSFDGSANRTLKLPATIKANITGNCSGASGSCTGNAATATKVNHSLSIGGKTYDGSANVSVTAGNINVLPESSAPATDKPSTWGALGPGLMYVGDSFSTLGTWGVLLNLYVSPSVMRQIVCGGDGTIYSRSGNFGSSGTDEWSAWATMAKTSQIPAASTTAPSMDGTASYGSGTAYARANHVHPTDTSRAASSHTHAGTDISSYSGTGTNSGARRIFISSSSPSGGNNGDVWIKY